MGSEQRNLRRICLVAVLVVCAGATKAGEPAPVPSDTDSYYLLQIVSPPKAEISIAQGKVIDGAYRADGTVFVTQTFKGIGTDGGFVLAKAAPDTTQGIRVIKMSDSIFAPVYFPCQKDFKTLAFDTQKGKVVYAGTVEYDYATEDGKISASYGEDIEAARAFLKSHYPQMVDELAPAVTYHVPGSRC